MTPAEPTPTPTPTPEPLQVREITLEEWIAATQSCSGIDSPDADLPQPPKLSVDQP